MDITESELVFQHVTSYEGNGERELYYSFRREPLELGRIYENALYEFVVLLPRTFTATDLREIADKLDELNGPKFVHQ